MPGVVDAVGLDWVIPASAVDTGSVAVPPPPPQACSTIAIAAATEAARATRAQTAGDWMNGETALRMEGNLGFIWRSAR